MRFTGISDNKNTLFFPEEIPATYDAWLLGDEFLQNIIGSWDSMVYETSKEKDAVPPYMADYYNVNQVTGSSSVDVPFAMVRMLNILDEFIHKMKKLPKYLIVIADCDILQDIDPIKLNIDNIEEMTSAIQELVRWFVRQIDLLIRRKKLDLLSKKPGALTGYAPKVIFIRMLRRAGRFRSESLNQLYDLRPKYNDALNDSVAKVNQYILTINSCKSYEDFDKHGKLSQ